jgi:hypothetical protein
MHRACRKPLASALLALGLLAAAGPAAADDYDPQYAGHPLRILAYALHPVGVILDICSFGPRIARSHDEDALRAHRHLTSAFFRSR